ncbi:MGMT family protein [Anaerococcus sp. NML200537]|uniref:methylated-DNA--[protein]-cysteine S-methyltransferase n=1 Tax=Anaerococcus sp. NML200537 TaxID=2954485 RepID=UPI002237E873|nr:MGMT family protein [Anaerococcus sp. NML200537]MCW6700860.1 MGMT family protein [Anaerococcus sp. NML200537]
MNYLYKYYTPRNFDNIIMTSEGNILTGLYFEKAFPFDEDDFIKNKPDIFKETISFLDLYFKGINPGFIPKFALPSMSDFRKSVIEILLTIPYGKVMTYKEIASLIAKKRKIKTMSSQAVGGAVGANPISIIIPCHRVIGSNMSLTGYAGGIDNKYELLKLEGHAMAKFKMPKKGKFL